MRVIIKDNDRSRPIKLRFPTALLFNRLTASLAPIVLRDSEVTITRHQAVRLVKELKRCKRKFRDWKIVEVKSADGEWVEVRL